jgi:hypothetical protein
LDDATAIADPLGAESTDGESLPASERSLLVARAAEIVQRELDPSTWEMFWQLSIEGRAVKEIAASRGLSVSGENVLLSNSQRYSLGQRVATEDGDGPLPRAR